VYERFRTLGAKGMAVVISRPEMLAAFLADEPLPFLLVADPAGEAFRAFGLGRTSWWRILRPRSVLRYLGLILRGTWPRRPNKGEDVLQLGGDFVLDQGGRVVFAYRSAEPTDRPAIDVLSREIERLRG
jgi:peroxiredoxin